MLRYGSLININPSLKYHERRLANLLWYCLASYNYLALESFTYKAIILLKLAQKLGQDIVVLVCSIELFPQLSFPLFSSLIIFFLAFSFPFFGKNVTDNDYLSFENENENCNVGWFFLDKWLTYMYSMKFIHHGRIWSL